MLKEITIKNFRSINEPITLSMDADVKRVSEFPTHIESIRENSLLKICSMYGPNGGGKSNIIYALFILSRLVKTGAMPFIPYNKKISCIFNDSPNVEITAFFAGKKFDLGYQIKFREREEENTTIDADERVAFRRRMASFNILEENIFVLTDGEYKQICERNELGEIDSDDEFLKTLFPIKLGSSLSVLRFAFENFYNENSKDFSYDEPRKNIDALIDLYEEINSICRIDSYIPNTSVVLEKNKNKVIELLNSSDIKVKDIKLEKSDEDTQIFFVRELIINGTTITRRINIREESNGTRKLFDIIMCLLSEEGNGAIFLGDDINAYLHPKLLSAIIEIITNENNHKFQLIFNSHDFINMTNKLFRRDEIWFAYRDELYQTKLIPLSNITNYKGKQIRKDVSYSRQYIEGKFGADPFIEKGLNWNEK